MEDNLDRIQTEFRQNLDKNQTKLDNAQKIQSMPEIDTFQENLEEIQTCKEKKIYNTQTNLAHPTIQTNLEQIQNTLVTGLVH